MHGPEASSPHVRAFMQRMPRRDTRPELLLRRALHRQGVRYRLHRADLPGCPDIVLVSLRLAVFVDGCFWHGCPVHAKAPRANAEFWATKLAANRARDARNDAQLVDLGWDVLHVWEHEDLDEIAGWLVERWGHRAR